MNGFWFYASCLVCKSGELCYWSHSKCKKTFDSNSNAKIDINGNLFCNGCHQMSSIINWRFRCQKHSFERLNNLTILMEVLQVMINMSKNIEDPKLFATMISNISEIWIKQFR